MEERIDWEFNKECHQKKNIGHSAQKKVRNRRRCTLPSDYLTPAQKKLNGEVVSVNMNAPIRYAEFKFLSHDLQEKYLNSLHDRFGASRNDICKMFGIGPQTLKKLVEMNGLNIWPASKGSRLTDPEGWEHFKKGLLTHPKLEEKLMEETIEMAKGGPVPERRPILDGSVDYVQKFDMLTVCFHGLENLEETVTILKNLPWNGQVKIRIEVETVGE